MKLGFQPVKLNCITFQAEGVVLDFLCRLTSGKAFSTFLWSQYCITVCMSQSLYQGSVEFAETAANKPWNTSYDQVLGQLREIVTHFLQTLFSYPNVIAKYNVRSKCSQHWQSHAHSIFYYPPPDYELCP